MSNPKKSSKSKVQYYILAGLVLIVAAVFTIVAISFNTSKENPSALLPGDSASTEAKIPTSIDSTTGAIVVGSSSNVLEEYFDFGCPHCGAYNAVYGADVQKFVEDGKLTLKMYPLGMLDASFMGTRFSTRSAAALYCVAENDPNSVFSFVEKMFASQPDEGTRGLRDDQIIDIAKSANATNSANCITSGTYKDFVSAKTKSVIYSDWFKGTPSLILNGTLINTSSVIGAITASIPEATATPTP